MDANPEFRRCVPGIVGRQATAAMTRADVLAHLPLWRELVDGRLDRNEIPATLRRPGGSTRPGQVVITAVTSATVPTARFPRPSAARRYASAAVRRPAPSRFDRTRFTPTIGHGSSAGRIGIDRAQ